MERLRAVIGLGSNLGDRAAALQGAVGRLGRIARVERLSRVYETAPVGGPPQPAFLNGAALVGYGGAPLDLLAALQGIEAGMGRPALGAKARERWGPRAIDLDILFFDGLAFESAELTVPHPRLPERAFALRPLVEVAPDAIDPWTQLPYAVLLMQLRSDPADLRVTTTNLAAAS